MMRNFQLYGLLILALMQAYPGSAKKKDKSRYRRVPPKYILVQLSTETNRMKALERAGRTADMKTLEKDAAIVRELTVKDFSQSFNYCPVYYFIDTDNPAVVKRQFDALLDKDMKKVNISIVDTNYLIVYYGSPAWQTRERKFETTTQDNMGGQPYGDALVFCNHEMKQVGYTYHLKSFFLLQKRTHYSYESKKFNIAYRSTAEDLDKRLKEYAKNYARKYKTADQ